MEQSPGYVSVCPCMSPCHCVPVHAACVCMYVLCVPCVPLPTYLQFEPSMQLTSDDFEHTRRAAMSSVRVPQNVIQLLADLRTYLQVC